ncbi:MAG TPA: hypothetical protein VG916_03695 [Gemmatimonadaceae bacterium]|nr:hypothetical protein [Gemmatimonadaceae bacterium]
MAAINTGSVVKAGLVAGLVLNVIDFLSNTFVLGRGMEAELTAINPSLWASMTDPRNNVVFVAIDFLLGLLLVWLYAAMRPRFGAGPRTAMRAGAFTWAVATLMWAFFLLMGITSFASYTLGAVISLANFLAAAWVGGRLYTEADA